MSRRAPGVAGIFDLRKSAAYSQIVNVGAEERSGFKRIAPGEPAGSFLVDKMLGHLHNREGKPMPSTPIRFPGAPHSQ